MMTNGVFIAILTSFVYSFMNVLVKLSSASISSHEVVFFRGLIGCIILYGLMKKKGVKFQNPFAPLLFFRALLGALYMICYFYAIEHMTLANAIILAHLSGAFVVILSWIFLKENMRSSFWLPIGIIFLGAMVIINPFRFSDYTYHALIGLLSAVLAAASTITIRKLTLAGEHHNYEIVFSFLFASTIVGMIFSYGSFRIPTAEDYLLLIPLGVISLLGQVLQTTGLRVSNAIIFETVRYIGIVFNILWGLFLFKEPLGWHSLLGCILIVGGSIVLSRMQSR